VPLLQFPADASATGFLVHAMGVDQILDAHAQGAEKDTLVIARSARQLAVHDCPNIQDVVPR
jgi:hypothetical protein